jgi:AcrR family transcriptional regulator
MTRIANRREYRSELRAEQADETRARILDATMRVISRGIAGVSIPAVAREAGVSIPTIYRQFGTKQELLAAVYPHVARRTGFDTVPDPRSLEELRNVVPAYFERLDRLDDLDRAALASPGAAEVRHATMPSRIERLRRIADSIAPKLPRADRDRITRLLAVLTASSSLRMWRDHLGSSVDQVADDMDWILRAALAAAKRRTGR